jgi:hypothetical protein
MAGGGVLGSAIAGVFGPNAETIKGTFAFASRRISTFEGTLKNAPAKTEKESKTASLNASRAAPEGGRNFFVGDWRVGRPGKADFVISLDEDSTAKSNASSQSGRWEFVDGEARITWSDGKRQVIRREGSGFRKLYFKPGASFDDPPTDMAAAEKIQPGK